VSLGTVRVCPENLLQEMIVKQHFGYESTRVLEHSQTPEEFEANTWLLFKCEQRLEAISPETVSKKACRGKSEDTSADNALRSARQSARQIARRSAGRCGRCQAKCLKYPLIVFVCI
jgi:hypothetical protein